MFKKILKYTALVLTVIFIVIQFFHPKKNIAEGPQPNYIGNHFPVHDNVKAIMAKACNDCHSNNTRYPWYSNIQPVALFLNKHIVEGKKELNFDEFGNYSKRRQQSKLKSIASQVNDGEMHLTSYKLLHKKARLSGKERSMITKWFMEKYDDSRN